MAFNFNWSPLAADGEFYRRARDLLTASLNKSPKPPIIVDDIFVTELNLGSVPPELEILEIGDLAEDRFRGIFKMCYGGDAFLTLRTRVQANPLNTYLDSKPSFTSPKPLAAAAGLTIPLSITLSEIRLSAFIILVFSRQKGLTLVFRNDPLESLKVSSTFDSILFVRDYLQRTIEGQLRNLIMDELPAIIHKLSLQFWCPDQAPKDPAGEGEEEKEEQVVDPLASPPLNPVDANGNVVDESEVARLSLNGGGEAQSMFAQKNLLFGSSLVDLNRTLQMRSPSVREVVFRGWAGPAEGRRWGGGGNVAANGAHALAVVGGPSKTPSVRTLSDSGSMSHGHLPSRPSLVSMHSATTGLSLGAGARSRSYAGRKKKTRVVNLRHPSSGDDMETRSETAAPGSSDGDDESVRAPLSEPLLVPAIPEDVEDEGPAEADADADADVPGHPRGGGGIVGRSPDVHRRPSSPSRTVSNRGGIDAFDGVPTPQQQQHAPTPRHQTSPSTAAAAAAGSSRSKEKQPLPLQPLLSLRSPRHPDARHRAVPSDTVVVDQQWIMKMAGEIARRVYDEKAGRQHAAWDDVDDVPPPAYEASN